jgi:hypothetical protein
LRFSQIKAVASEGRFSQTKVQHEGEKKDRIKDILRLFKLFVSVIIGLPLDLSLNKILGNAQKGN